MAHPVLNKGRSAVITGAAKGIGLAAARHLAGLGMNVVMADNDAVALDRAVAEVARTAPDASAVLGEVTDVSSLSSVERLKARACEAFGEVALLMNNAAIAPSARTWEGMETWQRLMAVNLWGVLHGVQTFTQAMVDQGTPGVIINVGSKQGITTPPGNPAYNVSKAAVKVLTLSCMIFEALSLSRRWTT
jgi:NAD(P)-dependent dehydrogenase (short-subunit alcohol dehydrogenase family)